MRTISKYIFVPYLFFLISISSYSQELSLPELKPYLKKSVIWRCASIDKEIPLNIYFEGDSAESEGSEVIVYVKNQAWERIGKESDLSILSDYIKKKFIVITVDFGNDPRAVSTHFDKDLHNIFKAVYGYKTESLLKDINLVPVKYRCFFLPEGYRVATGLVYWEIDKHAVYGTMEFIMKSYNEDIVPKVPGLKPVSSPMEMVDSKGEPFDYTVKMDIVYPSQAKKTLPAFFYSATLSKRNPNGKPGAYRPHMAGITMRGYVYVLMGHCFNPCVNHFFHFNKFELDHWNGLACYTAAMRYIHANAGKYNINTEYIGGLGHSKGQYAITRLSDPNHVGGDESKKYKGFPEGTPEPQPWQGYSSNIKVGYQSMGMGLFEPEYITPDYMPTIIACGEMERDVISKDGYPKFVKRLEELDVNYVDLFMQGLGHDLPYGYDEKIGIDRYQLVHDFFDRYLKVEEKLPPVALLISPRDNKEGVSPAGKISVQFAPVIDEESILKGNGIRVIQIKDNKEIKGSWMISRGGTKFTFTPEKALVNDEQYKIFITSKIKNKAGTFLKNEKITQFKVAEKTGLLLGTQLWTFHKYSFREAVDKVQKLGLNYVEVYYGQPLGKDFEGTMDFLMDKATQEKVLAYAKSKGVKIMASGVANCKDETKWEQLFEFAKSFGISIITCEPDYKHLKYIDQLANKYKIDVAIHNHPKPSLYWKPEMFLNAVKGLSGHIGACADVGHWKRMGIDPVEALKKYEGRLKSLHFKDIKAKEEGETEQHDVIWGIGVCNIDGIMKELNRQGFKGLISIEYEYNWENSVPDIKECIKYFNKKVDEIY